MCGRKDGHVNMANVEIHVTLYWESHNLKLLKKFLTFYRNRSFIANLKRTHLFLSWTRVHALSYLSSFRFFRQYPLCSFLHLHALHVPRLSRHSWFSSTNYIWWSNWPAGLRRESAATRLVRLRFRIPPGFWMLMLCVVQERSLRRADHPSRESYRLRCVIVCDLETSRLRWPWPALGCCVRQGTSLASVEV